MYKLKLTLICVYMSSDLFVCLWAHMHQAIFLFILQKICHQFWRDASVQCSNLFFY